MKPASAAWLVVALPAVGAALALVGFFGEVAWLYWLGFALCAVDLGLSSASGAMRAPLIPALLALLAAVVLPGPWWKAASFGLVAWSALDSAGALLLAAGRVLRR